MRALVLLAGVLGTVLLSTAAAAAPTVAATAGGTVVGMTRPGLNVFLGIPYARPPVGELRWREPQPVAPWPRRRSATRFAPSCLQGEPTPFGPYAAAFLIAPERSEDCLYLNVWAPSGGAGKRPVYVFIPGGAFQSGGANVAAYDGSGLARTGAVVVTINYRLGVLGFFAHPELTGESPLRSSGNYGLLDAIAALRWVRANIARFGGDPANVTVAGQSAGAGIVNSLLVSPLAAGLFHRAVLESGPILNLPMLPLAAAESAGVARAAKLGAKDIAALRAVPPSELMKPGLPGLPLPIVDGAVIPADPEGPRARIVSKVPVIAGYTRDETPEAEGPQTVAAFETEVRNRYGALAERVLALYPHDDDAEAARSGVRLARDRRVAGLLLWAERRRADGQPVYLYHYEHAFPGPDEARYGAFHTSEVPYLFGALNLAGARFTVADRRVSDAMQARWLTFMRSGSPNAVGEPEVWPLASREPASIWRIAPKDSGPLLDAERLALFRAFLAQGGKLGLL